MRKSHRFAVALTVLLAGCNDTSSFIQPSLDCSIANAFVVYLDEGVQDAAATTRALGAKHRFQVLDVFGTTAVPGGTPGFLARMTPLAAMGMAREHSVADIEPFVCDNGPIEVR